MTIVETTVCVALLGMIGMLGLGASRLRTLSGRIGSFVCGTRPGYPPGGAVVAGIADRVIVMRDGKIVPSERGAVAPPLVSLPDHQVAATARQEA